MVLYVSCSSHEWLSISDSKKREHAELKTWVAFNKDYNYSEWPCKELSVQVANFVQFQTYHEELKFFLITGNHLIESFIIWNFILLLMSHTHKNHKQKPAVRKLLLNIDIFHVCNVNRDFNWEKTHLSNKQSHPEQMSLAEPNLLFWTGLNAQTTSMFWYCHRGTF